MFKYTKFALFRGVVCFFLDVSCLSAAHDFRLRMLLFRVLLFSIAPPFHRVMTVWDDAIVTVNIGVF